MWYQTELDFMRNLLNKLNIQLLLLKRNKKPKNPIDLGIRKFLGRETDYCQMFDELLLKTMDNTIYKVTDPYKCNYFFLLIPVKSPTVLLIGPYMSVQLTHQQLLEEMERFSSHPQLLKEVENYYGSLPIVSNESFLLATINSFAETLWKSSESFSLVNRQEKYIPQNIFSPKELLDSSKDMIFKIEQMERRYAYENEMLKAISLGLSQKAELMLSHANLLLFEQRVSDPVQNLKNYCIIANTLLRKAAEKGFVHPIYLDVISSEFAREIEMIGSVSAGISLISEMPTAYCRLVNKHSMTNYSFHVRKILVFIDSNLAGDLSLTTLANMQNISAGYLSSLFKKETGKRLTDYVNGKRMDYASKLLTTTVLQIQTISQYCGIHDVNYFSKIFKKYCECTPKAFRQKHQA